MSDFNDFSSIEDYQGDYLSDVDTLLDTLTNPRSYEDVRREAIKKYSSVYKDSLAFDMVMADKSTRIRLLQDPVYINATKALKAFMYEEQLKEIRSLMVSARGEKDSSATKIRAIEMKNKLLFQDLMIDADESNALNISFTAMSKEDFEKLDSVEIFYGSGSSVDISKMRAEGEELTPEEKIKEKLKKETTKNGK